MLRIRIRNVNFWSGSDPVKSFGSWRIRIRNTANRYFLCLCGSAAGTELGGATSGPAATEAAEVREGRPIEVLPARAFRSAHLMNPINHRSSSHFLSVFLPVLRIKDKQLQEKPPSKKKNIHHCKTWHFLHFFWLIFALLDPADKNQYGSQIHNTAIKSTLLDMAYCYSY